MAFFHLADWGGHSMWVTPAAEYHDEYTGPPPDATREQVEAWLEDRDAGEYVLSVPFAGLDDIAIQGRPEQLRKFAEAVTLALNRQEGIT